MGKKKKSVFFQKFVLSRNQCTTRIQETWLQTGFPCQLKLVFRQKPVPSLPRSWPKPTVPDSENFAQCVHSSKITFFWKKFFTKTHRWRVAVWKEGVFSYRHRSVSAYAQYSWETIGTIYRWTFMCYCDDDAVCIIIKTIIHQSWMYCRGERVQRLIPLVSMHLYSLSLWRLLSSQNCGELLFAISFSLRDWYHLFSCNCTLSLSLSLSDDYWVCKIVAICCWQ